MPFVGGRETQMQRFEEVETHNVPLQQLFLAIAAVCAVELVVVLYQAGVVVRREVLVDA